MLGKKKNCLLNDYLNKWLLYILVNKMETWLTQQNQVSFIIKDLMSNLFLPLCLSLNHLEESWTSGSISSEMTHAGIHNPPLCAVASGRGRVDRLVWACHPHCAWQRWPSALPNIGISLSLRAAMIWWIKEVGRHGFWVIWQVPGSWSFLQSPILTSSFLSQDPKFFHHQLFMLWDISELLISKWLLNLVFV